MESTNQPVYSNVARGQNRLSALAATLTAKTGRKVDILPADLTVKAGLSLVEQRLRSDESIPPWSTMPASAPLPS